MTVPLEHPLRDSQGQSYAHRVVAHSKHAGVCPPCYWCGAVLMWSTAVVDHLNERKTDNRADNLVVACSPCNRARGAMLPFLSRMLDASWPEFIRHADAFRKTVQEDGGFGNLIRNN